MLYINNNINMPNRRMNDNNVKESQSNIKNSFDSILSNTIDEKKELQFSKHANMRLNLRNINLSESQLERVNEGISNASKKGITDSLILVDNVALVVNVKNRVVITALKEEKNNIFTNINGAVIV